MSAHFWLRLLSRKVKKMSEKKNNRKRSFLMNDPNYIRYSNKINTNAWYLDNYLYDFSRSLCPYIGTAQLKIARFCGWRCDKMIFNMCQATIFDFVVMASPPLTLYAHMVEPTYTNNANRAKAHILTHTCTQSVISIHINSRHILNVKCLYAIHRSDKTILCIWSLTIFLWQRTIFRFYYLGIYGFWFSVPSIHTHMYESKKPLPP